MTYNLGEGLATPEKLIPFLRSSGADFIGLQEVTAGNRNGVVDQLTDLYPYRAVYGLGIPGTGLLSRYPILQSELLELNPGRPDLRAVVDFDGVQVTIIVAHPPPPRACGRAFGRGRARPSRSRRSSQSSSRQTDH